MLAGKCPCHCATATPSASQSYRKSFHLHVVVPEPGFITAVYWRAGIGAGFQTWSQELKLALLAGFSVCLELQSYRTWLTPDMWLDVFTKAFNSKDIS